MGRSMKDFTCLQDDVVLAIISNTLPDRATTAAVCQRYTVYDLKKAWRRASTRLDSLPITDPVEFARRLKQAERNFDHLRNRLLQTTRPAGAGTA